MQDSDNTPTRPDWQTTPAVQAWLRTFVIAVLSYWDAEFANMNRIAQVQEAGAVLAEMKLPAWEDCQ